MDIPAGFRRAGDSELELVVRDDAAEWLVPQLLGALRAWPPAGGQVLAGGRGATLRLNDIVIRKYQRGGLPSWFNHDLYFDKQRRPEQELSVTVALQRRGVPVVPALACAVRQSGPGYRGWFVSPYISDSCNLWLWMRDKHPRTERTAVLRSTGQAIRAMRQAGVAHPDLNLQNVLVHDGKASLLDFDLATAGARPLTGPAPEVARLARSAHKLDPLGRFIDHDDLAVIEAACSEEP